MGRRPGSVYSTGNHRQAYQLGLDRESYKPGDTARLFIPNPFSTAVDALLTVERGVVLEHQTLRLEPGGTTLDLPLTADDAPNVYISVTLLDTPASQIANPESPITMPDFRQGYINLPVDPVEQSLNVQITRTPEKNRSGWESRLRNSGHGLGRGTGAGRVFAGGGRSGCVSSSRSKFD